MAEDDGKLMVWATGDNAGKLALVSDFNKVIVQSSIHGDCCASTGRCCCGGDFGDPYVECFENLTEEQCASLGDGIECPQGWDWLDNTECYPSVVPCPHPNGWVWLDPECCCGNDCDTDAQNQDECEARNELGDPDLWCIKPARGVCCEALTYTCTENVRSTDCPTTETQTHYPYYVYPGLTCDNLDEYGLPFCLPPAECGRCRPDEWTPRAMILVLSGITPCNCGCWDRFDFHEDYRPFATSTPSPNGTYLLTQHPDNSCVWIGGPTLFMNLKYWSVSENDGCISVYHEQDLAFRPYSTIENNGAAWGTMKRYLGGNNYSTWQMLGDADITTYGGCNNTSVWRNGYEWLCSDYWACNPDYSHRMYGKGGTATLTPVR